MKDDFTCDSFFKVKKLNCYWDGEELPISYGEDKSHINSLGYEDIAHYDYSFSFLNKYKPTKIEISTTTSGMQAHIQSLDNILKCNSIKKIKFEQHETPISFFEKLASSNIFHQIKSLSICIYNSAFEDPSIIQSLIESSSSLKKLSIDKHYYYGKTFKLPPSIFQSLKTTNSPIKKLGLQIYNIKDKNELTPLIDLPNINQLYCNNDNIDSFLNHCNENKNIQYLTVYRSDGYVKENSKSLESFSNNNTSFLKSISFKHYFIIDKLILSNNKLPLIIFKK